MNSFLINDEARIGARPRAKAGAYPQSRLEKPGIVEHDALRVLLFCAIAPIEVKSSSGLLEIAEPYKRFF